MVATYIEVTVEIVVGTKKDGGDKTVKELYLVDAQSITEAEAKVALDFEASGSSLDYRVVSAKESRIMRIIE